MASTVLIMGESGTGKSTSIRNLDAGETFILNVLDKPLPFKGYRKLYTKFGKDTPNGNYRASDKADTLLSIIKHVDLKMPEIKTLVIDDFQYIMANEFMLRAREKGYDKFTEIGQKAWSIIERCGLCRDNLDVFVLSHTETDSFGKSKIKTIGKMLDNAITIEGMFTIVLHSIVANGEYKFLTQNDGFHIAKSPMGMFADSLIDNDLKEIKAKMIEYFGDVEMDIPEPLTETQAIN